MMLQLPLHGNRLHQQRWRESAGEWMVHRVLQEHWKHWGFVLWMNEAGEACGKAANSDAFRASRWTDTLQDRQWGGNEAKNMMVNRCNELHILRMCMPKQSERAPRP